jgi:hypothetical protein
MAWQTTGVASKDRLIVGPLVVVSMTMLVRAAAAHGRALTTMWNQQHFLMQLTAFRGFTISRPGRGPESGKWDMALNWVLYGNMFLTAPLFVNLWLRELYRFHMHVPADAVITLEWISWTATAVFLVLYVAYQVSSYRKGFALNPIKYLYIFLSYGVLYFVSWHTASVLVHAIANMVMHGIQYNVIVYWYIRRKVEQTGERRGLIATLVRPGNGILFVLFCLLYAVIYNVLRETIATSAWAAALRDLTAGYDAIPQLQIDRLNPQTGLEIMAVALLSLPGLLHLYYDSFIWKVRDAKVQTGL